MKCLVLDKKILILSGRGHNYIGYGFYYFINDQTRSLLSYGKKGIEQNLAAVTQVSRRKVEQITLGQKQELVVLQCLLIKLEDSKRWRIVEAVLQHNHTVSAEIRRFYKSHKKMILASKKQQELTPVTEVHTIKLYHTSIDAAYNGSKKSRKQIVGFLLIPQSI